MAAVLTEEFQTTLERFGRVAPAPVVAVIPILAQLIGQVS